MKTARAGWDIELAANAVADAAAAIAATDADPALTEAMLADFYRDEGIAPLDPANFGVLTADMDDAHWQRMAVVVALLAQPPLRAVLPVVSQRLRVRDQIERLVKVVRELSALELRAFAVSMVRAEELARRVAREWGVEIRGETPHESLQRLHRIDYTRLLANVDTAKANAQEQMAELQRQQEAQDSRIARRQRGKW